ncbi:MAG: hypothetical protein ACR2KE_05655 [Candidatus Nanopelagicales bacterium]
MRRLVTFAAAAATLAATLSVAGATGAAEKAVITRQIVFVVDSTGLSAQDWIVQKRSYLALLDDTHAFPLDGSTSVAFIQYAATAGGGQASRVTLPLTPLDGMSARGKVTSSILAATLLAPEKPGVDGFTAAAQELSERGTKSASASICATANAPWESATLTKGVNATRNAGATRLSMLTLITPTLTPSLASQTFDGAVFGDGAVVSARNAPQFGNLVGSSCLLPNLRLEAIEVNQVIQDWNNSVPLVEHKDTIVRVFLETVALPETTTTGLLHGERNGVPLTGSPLSPINDGGSVTIDEFIDYSAEREQLDASLNFRLPTSWQSGDVTLTFEAPSTLTCSSAPTGQHDCDVDVTFHEAQEPRVDYVSVPYEFMGTAYEPSDAALVENMYRTEDIFPVQRIDFDFDWLPWTVDDTKPALGLVNSALTLYGLYEYYADFPEGCDPDCHYYGIMDGNGGGLANAIPGTVGSGFLSGTGDTEAYGYGRNRGPHEIAHMIGAPHIVNDDQNGTTGSSKNGWCTEVGGRAAPDYPYWRSSSAMGQDVPTLGPMTSDDVEIWGMAPRFVNDNEDLAISDPWTVFPLMSYCSALDPSSQYRWPSTQTYDILTDALVTTRSRRAAVEAKPTPVVVVRGIVDADGARFLPVAPLTLPTTPTSSRGDWSVRLTDRKGKVLATRSFAMTVNHGDAAEPEGGEPAESLQFSVPFPAALGSQIGAIQLLRGQKVVATQRASAAAPIVAISSPKSGITLGQESITLTWSARDRDSADVTATVLYRTGPRAAWTPVAIDAVGTSVTFPRKAIEGSRTGEFMVIANDGIRWGTAKVGPLRVADNVPILSLQQAESNIAAAQNLVFEAAAWDSEDGVLDQQITWTSDLDGRLGSGRAVDLEATDLSEGVHVITVRATDSAKQSASAEFTLRVSRVAESIVQKQG